MPSSYKPHCHQDPRTRDSSEVNNSDTIIDYLKHETMTSLSTDAVNITSDSSCAKGANVDSASVSPISAKSQSEHPRSHVIYNATAADTTAEDNAHPMRASFVPEETASCDRQVEDRLKLLQLQANSISGSLKRCNIRTHAKPDVCHGRNDNEARNKDGVLPGILGYESTPRGRYNYACV